VNGWIESSPSIAKDVGLSWLRDMGFDNTPNRTIVFKILQIGV
jgi:hypothetical protein